MSGLDFNSRGVEIHRGSIPPLKRRRNNSARRARVRRHSVSGRVRMCGACTLVHSFARRTHMDNGFAFDSRREKGSGSIPGRPRPYSKRNMNSRTAGYEIRSNCKTCARRRATINSIGGLVVEYIVAIDVTRVRFPADAHSPWGCPSRGPFSIV